MTVTRTLFFRTTLCPSWQSVFLPIHGTRLYPLRFLAPDSYEWHARGR